MELIAQLAAVGAVLAALAAFSWWMRRRGFAATALGHPRRERRLQSMERLPLGPHHTLHLVKLGPRALVVASSAAGCTLLESTDWREIEAEVLR
jgi:flagellar biogenesis protein FliO